jgi:hypothetical protein
MEYLDEDRYPTEEYLNWLKDWRSWVEEGTSDAMVPNILQSLKETWTYGSIEIKRPYNAQFVVELHTYGWSGNEEIIEALEKNPLFWSNWIRHDVGGHYYFKFPKKYLA